MTNPGLSCVFVQGLLFPGYAYRIPALRAIPGSTFERENHLRVAHAVAEAELIEIVLDVFSTDRHSISLLAAAAEETAARRVADAGSPRCAA